MWRKASWQLIKKDDKKEWDSLDIVSKWLIATRSAVTLVTVYSCVISGLLAWRDGNFSWIPFLILTLGLFSAHGTNNLLNDYTDYSRGLDKDNYFRTQYGVHPLVQGLFTKPQQIRQFLVSGVLAALAVAGIYALLATDFDPVVIGLFVFGAIVLLAYMYPSKYWGLGEFAIFLIWGPIMIGGVYRVLVPRYFTSVMLIVFFTFKHAWNVIKVLNSPCRAQPPPNWPAWPTWFSGFAFFHNRQFGGWLIIGLIVDTLLHVIPFTAGLISRYWSPM